MAQSKSFSLIKSLSEDEQKKIQSGLQAKGRKGQTPEVLAQFFNLVISVVKKGSNNGNPTSIKEWIWKKLCPGENYNDNRFRKHAFRMNQYVQDFLLDEKWANEEQNAFKQELLYETFWERNQTKALESLGKRLGGDLLKIVGLRKFMVTREILIKGEESRNRLQTEADFSNLRRLIEIEQSFDSIKLVCLELASGKEVDPEEIRRLTVQGNKYHQTSELYQLNWKLFLVMTDLLNMCDLKGIEGARSERAKEFVQYFHHTSPISFREKYLVYHTFSNFLKSRMECEDRGASDFLESILELHARFIECAGKFCTAMEAEKFLYLFDLGVGQLKSDMAGELLDKYLHLVEDEFQDKLGITIRSLYLFADGAFQEVLDLADLEALKKDPVDDAEKRFDIRLGLIQMQSRIAISHQVSVGGLSRWMNKCIKKCPSLNKATKSALHNMVEYSMMLTKKFTPDVMEDHLKKIQEIEDIQGLEIHKDWLHRRFKIKAQRPTQAPKPFQAQEPVLAYSIQ